MTHSSRSDSFLLFGVSSHVFVFWKTEEVLSMYVQEIDGIWLRAPRTMSMIPTCLHVCCMPSKPRAAS